MSQGYVCVFLDNPNKDCCCSLLNERVAESFGLSQAGGRTQYHDLAAFSYKHFIYTNVYTLSN